MALGRVDNSQYKQSLKDTGQWEWRLGGRRLGREAEMCVSWGYPDSLQAYLALLPSTKVCRGSR